PSLGHSLRSPFSCEIPLRSGPRHCGQSCAGVVTDKHNKSAAVVASDLKVIVFSLAQFRDYLYWCLLETQRKRREFRRMSFGNGGAEGDRTPDLMTASHALSQLSSGPISSELVLVKLMQTSLAFCAESSNQFD